jgi:hypothetical protein
MVKCDFNILDKNYKDTLNVSATQQLHKIIIEQKRMKQMTLNNK